MMLYFEFEKFTHHTLDLLNPGVAEFDNLSAIDADNMIMLLVSLGFFELCHVLSKLMFGYQVTGN